MRLKLLGRRKNIKPLNDTNNYIGNDGVTTHICNTCKNIYTAKLNLELQGTIYDKTDGGEVIVEIPAVRIMCTKCNRLATQVDNNMVDIVKKLVDKRYTVSLANEGHAFTTHDNYEFPVIIIKERLIVNKIFEHLSIDPKLDTTTIKPLDTSQDLAEDEFIEYKNLILTEMMQLAEYIPESDSRNGRIIDGSTIDMYR